MVGAESFGVLVAQHRRAQGWTRQELAARSGYGGRELANLDYGASRASRQDTLRARADIALLDSSPNLGVADALVVQPSVDGTIPVVDTRGTDAHALDRALALPEQVLGRVLGVVLNNYASHDASVCGYGCDKRDDSGDRQHRLRAHVVQGRSA